eukprot:TRINITY_DN3208_c1_g1_i2.p1 TRINITY_DN3208_c1_g1~~TRINITY_DN3208_c1_g1_i2.p1  ORF type:complete len:266 (-),score=59.86 TRINITY_DN3208_c1_g1_i2:45-842(-)
MDNTMQNILVHCDQELFGTDFETATSEYSKVIPMLEKDSTRRWGLLDIARYYNDGTNIEEDGQELNCVEHYDPGLLSLSVLSTEPGLQVKDEHGNWIDMPCAKDSGNIGILWCGEIAQRVGNHSLKPCIHRVLHNADVSSRITMWHEVCVQSQSLDDIDLEEEVVLNNLTNPNRNTTEKTDDPIVMNQVEFDLGMPISKSGIMYDEPLIQQIHPQETLKGLQTLGDKPEHTSTRNIELEFGTPLTKAITLTPGHHEFDTDLNNHE